MSGARHLRIALQLERYRTLMPQLHEAPVRDLAWLLLSSDLLRADGANAFPAELGNATPSDAELAMLERWLLAQDRQPASLKTFLAAGESARLGRYAERLLQFYLREGPGYELMAAGLQVRDRRQGGQTLGECDFLIRHLASQRMLHWELAVKLYLYVPPGGEDTSVDDPSIASAEQYRWLGPNLADSLGDKLQHLLLHQLRLTTMEAAQSILPHAGPWQAQAYLKGWMFHPLGAGRDAVPSVPLPAVISAGHGRGWWATRAEWQQATDAAANGSAVAAWSVLPRVHWLAPARLTASEVMDRPALGARIAALWQNGQPHEPLLVVGLAENADGTWDETQRGFIVPDDWLARARRRMAELWQRAAQRGETS